MVFSWVLRHRALKPRNHQNHRLQVWFPNEFWEGREKEKYISWSIKLRNHYNHKLWVWLSNEFWEGGDKEEYDLWALKNRSHSICIALIVVVNMINEPVELSSLEIIKTISSRYGFLMSFERVVEKEKYTFWAIKPRKRGNHTL